MKKLFTFLFCFGLLSNSLFAHEEKGKFLIGVGVGYESIQKNSKSVIDAIIDKYFDENANIAERKFSDEKTENDSKAYNNYPLFINIGYRFYLIDKLALETRAYASYSKSSYSHKIKQMDVESSLKAFDFNEMFNLDYRLEPVTITTASNAKYNKIDLGFIIAGQYDFYRYSPKAVYGLELGLGYEYSIINNKFDNSTFEKEFKVDNTGSILFDYGLYFIYDNTHRISINSQIKNYTQKTYKIDSYSDEFSVGKRRISSNEYSLKPGNYTTTISYSYLF